MSVGKKLFLALLLAMGLVVAGMVVFMTWSFERGFVGFVEARQAERVSALIERLAALYADEGGWQRLRESKARWIAVLTEGLGRPEEGRPRPWMRWAHRDRPHDWPPRRFDGPKHGHRSLELRVMLLDADRSIIFGRAEQVSQLALHAIKEDGRTVGYLGVLPGPALDRIGDIRFLEKQTQSFLIIALATVVLAAAFALLLAHRLVRPLRAFTTASRALAAGRYDTRVPAQSSDEIGRLGRDLNDLAKALERNELLRRQWMADVSHELRTPLAVLRGELEALQDGVRPLDANAVDSLHGEILRLGRLVEDLYELSLSDLGALTYRKTDAEVGKVLRDALARLASDFEQKGIEVQVDVGTVSSLSIHADPDRLAQLFRNLLANSLRYTDSGGKLVIAATCQDGNVAFDFQDSAPGVPEADLPRLFERFYRTEASRSRAYGGAGLGLAICRNIVEAHGGCISARPSPLGGLWVRVELPL